MDFPRRGTTPNTAMLPGERVVFEISPAPASVLIRSAWWLAGCAVVAGSGIGLLGSPTFAGWGAGAAELAVLVVVVVVVIEAIRRRFTRFLLSDRRIAAATGVFVRVAMEVGPSGVRHVAMRKSILERVFGLGTIAIATAGADGYEVVWWNIAEPEAALGRLRAGLAAWNPLMPVRFEPGMGDGARGGPAGLPRRPRPFIMGPVPQPIPRPVDTDPVRQSEVPQPTTAPASVPEPSIPVIGIAGGIGAGKTYVAHLFERLGCYVVDSDARAKAALDRPDVREELVRWWGERVLSDDGRVDRAEIAKIVFTNPEERRRLESLVHPIVRQDRERLIAEASGFWPRAIIVDAPLLFEAGVDKECDAVVFVEAPFEERLRRVRETRGWSEADLSRREGSQWPLEQKRANSQYVLENTGSEADILRRVQEVLELVRAPQDTAQAPQPSAPPNPA